MSARAWWSRIRGSLRGGDSVERDMRREMEFHLEMAAQRNVERGMTPEAARRHAILKFGSTQRFQEEAREVSRARVAENVVADVRFALRGLRRSPSFTVAAILTVALGVGASTAIFTVVNAVLLRPLPIPRPADFAYVGWAWAKGGEIPALTALQYEFVRSHNRAFEAVATHSPSEMHLGDESTAQPVHGLRVAGDFFGVIGIRPALGRAFDARELAAGDSSLVILGHDVWSARFGADPAVVGRSILLDGTPRIVVGVLPAEFHFPPAPLNAGYLVPFRVYVDPVDQGHNSDVIGRLRHGTSAEARAAEMRILTEAFRAAHPTLALDGELRLFTHRDAHVAGTIQHTLWVLLGAVMLVLVIACANTATLLLARAWGRQREIAVRASLGAGPRRILQQLLTEGILLSGVAAAVGVLFSVAAVRGFVALAHGVLPVGVDPGIDVRVLAYAVGASLVTGLLFGLAAGVPALRLRMHDVLLAGGRGASAGGTRIREALVFLQTTVAVVLLAGATLLTASFARLIRVDPGFEPDRVVAVRLGRLPSDYDSARRAILVDRLLDRIRSLPPVERVAAAPSLPLERGMNFPVDVPEHPERAIGAVELRYVSPAYLATLGIPLRGGRDFVDADAAEPVAIVNEAFAKHFWDRPPAAGRTIRIGHFKDRWIVDPAGQHETRVIGVAADIHELGLDRPARPTVLVPRPHGERTPVLLVRGESPALMDALRRAVVAEEPRLAPTVERLSSVVSRSVSAPRFRMLLVGSFAMFALLLAAVGIYGVIGSVVQQRQREIGIRLALGSTRAAVATAVVRRSLVNVTAGAVAGLVLFWTARHVLSSWLYDIAPGDPRLLAAAIGVLAIVALLASWLPARRAARIDPALALRLD